MPLLLLLVFIIQVPLASIHAERLKKVSPLLLFRYAYSIEKKIPYRAMETYRWAFENGLRYNKDLSRTAFWRLYYLYIQYENYLDAILMLEERQKWNPRKYNTKDILILDNKLRSLIVKNWKLDDINVLFLRDAIKAFSNNQKETITYLEQIIKQNIENKTLHDNILSLCIKKNKMFMAKSILKILIKYNNSKRRSYRLEYAALEIKENSFWDAEETLVKLADESLNSLEKRQMIFFYYLLGITQRGLKRYPESIVYFKKAISLSKTQENKKIYKIYAQIALSLYLDNKIKEAFTTLSGQKILANSEEEIIWLLIKSKYKKNKASKRKLKRMLSYLKARREKRNSIVITSTLKHLKR